MIQWDAICEHGNELREFSLLLWQASLLTARLQEVEHTQGEIAGAKIFMEQLAAQASSRTRLADEHAQRISQLEQLAAVSGTATCITDVLVGCMGALQCMKLHTQPQSRQQVLGTGTHTMRSSLLNLLHYFAQSY